MITNMAVGENIERVKVANNVRCRKIKSDAITYDHAIPIIYQESIPNTKGMIEKRVKIAFQGSSTEIETCRDSRNCKYNNVRCHDMK